MDLLIQNQQILMTVQNRRVAAVQIFHYTLVLSKMNIFYCNYPGPAPALFRDVQNVATK